MWELYSIHQGLIRVSQCDCNIISIVKQKIKLCDNEIVLNNFSSAYYNVVERYFPYGNRKLNHGTMRKCWATANPRITMSCKDSCHSNYNAESYDTEIAWPCSQSVTTMWLKDSFESEGDNEIVWEWDNAK